MDDLSKSVTFGWSGKSSVQMHQNLPVSLSTLQTAHVSVVQPAIIKLDVKGGETPHSLKTP